MTDPTSDAKQDPSAPDSDSAVSATVTQSPSDPTATPAPGSGSEQADVASAAPAETAGTSSGQESAGQDTSAEKTPATNRPESGQAAKGPILIGSQRDPANKQLSPRQPKAVREVATRTEPKSEPTPSEPSPQPATATPTTATAAAPTAVEAKPAVDAGVADAGAVASAEPTAPETTVAEPVATDQPASSHSATELPGEEDLPQVVMKAPLNDDLEQEINDALGDMSIEAIMSGAAGADSSDDLVENSRHKATVVKLHRDDVFFTLGGRHEGTVSVKQFKKPPQPGAMLEVIVTGFDSEEGLYSLSIPGAAVSVSDWEDLSEGTVVEARVTGANTGGLECMVNNIRGFIPASQISMYRVENLSEFINQKLQCVVTEANPRRRNLVLSHRSILEREHEVKKKETVDKLEEGQICEGTVRNLREFGAFVELAPGVDGLIHISKLSWDRVEHPSEVVKEGDTVRVKIEKINKQTGKIGLSRRDLLEQPWDHAEEKYPADSIVKGTVSRIANFGAFVKLEPGIEGMVHISELAHHRVMTVSNIVREGEEVEVKVLSVDRENQRMALSLKATQTAPEGKKRDKREDEADEPVREPAVARRKGPLKGGKDAPSGGDQFGLKW